MLDRFHKGQRIAKGAPGVEGRESSGAMKKDQRAAHFFKVGPQSDQCAMQIVWAAFKSEPAEAGSVHQGFPTEMSRLGGATEEFDGARQVGGKRADFGDGRFFGVRKRPKVLTRAPNRERDFGDLLRVAERAQMNSLRVEASFGAFKEDVDGRGRFCGGVRLNRDVGELGLHGRVSSGSVYVAPPVRIWLDMLGEPRGEDAAALFREAVIGW